MSTVNSIADVEGFVELLRMAQEAQPVKDFLLTTLRGSLTERHANIQALANQLMLDRAPPQLVAAVLCLRDDAVAEEALALLEPQEP